jgi:hypothetical protein
MTMTWMLLCRTASGSAIVSHSRKLRILHCDDDEDDDDDDDDD